MKYTSPVRKVTYRIFDPQGALEQTGESTYKKGHWLRIPLPIKAQKRFLIKKIFEKDEAELKRGYTFAVTFGDVKGTQGCLITKEDL